MDGDVSDFSFSTASEYLKGQDASDISWADIFLDGIHSDDAISQEAGGLRVGASTLSADIHGAGQQLHHQAQQDMMGGQLQIHIPAQLQGRFHNSAVQPAGANLCGTVAYLAPSASTHQYVSAAAGGIHNVMTAASHHPGATSVVQQQQQNTKLLHIAPSFPVTQLPNSMPLQSILQPSQSLTNQTLYSSQGPGMFPAQGSVHIENPKVVNVNFGSHVIGSDGSGQQTIFQTAEGKRVLITNSQLQHMSQSINLTQPLVGTQLINTAGGNVIRANIAPGTHTIMPAGAAAPSQQIVLPSGQTVISQQTSNPHGGLAKNVVLRSLNSNMSPVIYQSGQGGQLIHSQPTLISGPGLQVVNAGGGQGNQVQLIAQPSLSQAGQQQQQGTVMNVINNSSVLPSAGNQITGLVPGQNIFVNGQVLNFGQLRSLAMPQLHMQHNSQSGLTLADINATVTCTAQFQPSTPQLVIQHNGQQQQILLQSKNNPLSSVITSSAQSQRLLSGVAGYKSTRTPTPTASSASSTPVLTPTPSTPTPTPTPELMSDFPGGPGNQGINILKQALDMSNIDLQSFEDDINFLDSSTDCFSLLSAQPPSLKPLTKFSRSKSKLSKSKSNSFQQFDNVPIGNNCIAPFQQTSHFPNTQGLNLNPSSEQKIFAANGQTFVLSANNQQLILQPSVTSSSPSSCEYKPLTSLEADRLQVSSSSISHLEMKGFNQEIVSSTVEGQLKMRPHNNSSQDRNVFIKADIDRNALVKTCSNEVKSLHIETAMSGFPADQPVYATASDFSSSPSPVCSSSSDFSQTNLQQVKNQNVISGTFIRQTPLMPVIKQETTSDWNQSVLPHVTTVGATPNAAISIPTSSFGAMTTPVLISSPSFTTVATTTTQSHHATIMSTVQTSASSSSNYLSHTSAFGDIKTLVPASTIYQPMNTSHSIFNHFGSTNIPANDKSIVDSTLMLSLTPTQKERLENQLARMNKKDQEEFLTHQQNVMQRTMQAQLDHHSKHQQNQQFHLQEQQTQEFQQSQMVQDEISQFQQQSQKQAQQTYQPLQQSSSVETCYSSVQLVHDNSITPELLSPQTVPGLPTTVQELTEETEKLQNYQSEQSLQHHYPAGLSQTDLQQTRAPCGDPGQQFVTLQKGRCLAEQQLLRDCSLALDPDVSSPFKSFSDAMRRLVRYHSLQDHKPEEGSKALRIWDSRYSKLCDYLVRKKRCYIRRFNKMKLYQDMCPKKQPEYIQNLACFNEQLRTLIKREQEGLVKQSDLFGSGLSSSSWPTSISDRVEDALSIKTTTVQDRDAHHFTLKDLAVNRYPTRDPTSRSKKSENSRKRSASDTGGSSGMLKLVFKRKANENYLFVRNPLANVNELPRDLRPVVNLEKSDSEYEFDSSTADVTCNQPVIVRRRKLSVMSRQTSIDVRCDNNSNSSYNENSCDTSSSEEEDSDDEEEEKVEFENGQIYDDASKLKRLPKHDYHVSFRDKAYDSSSAVESDDDSSSVDSDTFMEHGQFVSNQHCKISSMCSSFRPIVSLGIDDKSSDIQNLNTEGKLPHHLSHNAAVTSHNVFSSSVPYSHVQSLPNKAQVSSYTAFSVGSGLDHHGFSHTDDGSVTFDHTSPKATLLSPEEVYVADSPVRNLEEGAARKALINCSLFTTPNKSLLKTDAMFNSEDEDDGVRMVSKFKLNNKDPQSSMIDDSVRSVINSVLNNDGEDDHRDSQTSWVPSSAVGHRNLFQPYSSIMIPSGHGRDLDLTVQSILNS